MSSLSAYSRSNQAFRHGPTKHSNSILRSNKSRHSIAKFLFQIVLVTLASGFQHQSIVSNVKFVVEEINQPRAHELTVTQNTQLQEFTKAHNLTPLERMAVTASGNLQILFSSFYNKPMIVTVRHFGQIIDNKVNFNDDTSPLAVYERDVGMSIGGLNLCDAISTVRVYCPEVAEVLATKQIGIGQLFRHLKMRPKYALHDVGRNPDGGLWRKYSLECDKRIKCEIREDFSPHCWDVVFISNDGYNKLDLAQDDQTPPAAGI